MQNNTTKRYTEVKMSNKKQSSIDYAVEKLEKLIPPGNQIIIHIILEQAKAMHKQESIAAQMDMFHHLNNLPFGMQYLDKRESAEQFAEQYYNKTFGGNNGK